MTDRLNSPQTPPTSHLQTTEDAHGSRVANSPENLSGEVEDLRQSLNLMIREMGRIQQSLARIESRGAVKEAPTAEDLRWDMLNSTLVEIKERVTREAISSARERRDIRKDLTDLQSQLQSLQKSNRFATQSVREIPEEDQRIGIFVDVQNIFYAAKQFNARLDFEKLLQVTVGRRRLVRAIAYVVQSPEVNQSGFISMLQQKGYEVKQKDLRLRSDGSAKGDWDMGMAIDIMELVDKLNVMVLVTGDGDFVSLLNLVKTIGPRVELVSFLHNTARDLIQSADLHIPIEETLLMRPSNNGVNAQNSAGAKAAANLQTPASEGRE